MRESIVAFSYSIPKCWSSKEKNWFVIEKQKQNYTVTLLEFAFLVIVLSWIWRVRFSRNILPAGKWMYKYRQIIYSYVSAPLNGTALTLSLKQLISEAFLQVAMMKKTWSSSRQIFLSEMSAVEIRLIACRESTRAFTFRLKRLATLMQTASLYTKLFTA